MSCLLEVLGRGLLGRMDGAFGTLLGAASDETLEDLERLVAQMPDDLDARVRLGGRHLRNDDPMSARRVFADALKANAKSLGARVGLACALDDLGQLEQALEQLRIAQTADPASPSILFCIGYCHERAGREIEAIHYYRDAITFCPTLRNAHERLAAIFLHRKEIELAIKLYEELCRLDPERIELHLTLANLLLKQGKSAEAIRVYEHAIAMEPENWTAQNDVVAAYEEAGLIREAIEHLHKLIEIQPDQADNRLHLGDLYARIGNAEAALAQYQSAVNAAPDCLEANVRIGTQHLRAGRHKDAARWFAFALELNDRLLGAYVGLGVAQRAAGRSDEAAASLETARTIEPNSTLLFSEIARMHLRSAAAEAAGDHLKIPVDEAGHKPSRVQKTEGDLISQQIERHRSALAERPNHADIHYRLGLLLRNRGQAEEAIGCYQRAVAINPSYMKALIKLGLALKEVGRDAEAEAIFVQATELHPEYADLHYQLGLLFVQRQQFELAVERFAQAAERNPQNIEFQANLALALQNMALVDRAKATWQIVQELAPADSPFALQARGALARKKGT